MIFFSVFLHAGEQNQVIGQICQSSGLTLNVANPLIFSQIHLQYFRICIDDRQRSFQLMTGICDKSFLFLIIFHKRLYNIS